MCVYFKYKVEDDGFAPEDYGPKVRRSRSITRISFHLYRLDSRKDRPDVEHDLRPLP